LGAAVGLIVAACGSTFGAGTVDRIKVAVRSVGLSGEKVKRRIKPKKGRVTMKKLLFMFVLTMFSAHAAGAANGFYTGISAGPSRESTWCDGLSGSCEDSDTGWKVFGGYQATKNFGIEVSYVDFGQWTASGALTDAPSRLVTGKAEVSGFGVSWVATLPVSERFGLFGRVGLFRWDSEFRGTIKIPGTPGDDVLPDGYLLLVEGEDDGVDPTYGLGATVRVTEHVAVRVEWEQFSDVDEEDVRLLSAGVVLSF